MQRCIVVLTVMLGFAGVVAAEWQLWGNGSLHFPDAPPAVILAFDSAGGASSFYTEVADDVIFDRLVTITACGLYCQFAADVDVDHWIINFYDDAAGLPGSLLHTTTAAGGLYPASGAFGQTVYARLDVPFTPATNTRYWIGLQAAFDQSQGFQVRWYETDNVDPAHVQGNVAYWRGNQAIEGLTAADTWEPVGQKDGLAATAEMAFDLWGLIVGYLCGDANCDGLVNNADIDAFLLALTDPRAYSERYGCAANCDTNLDTLVNSGDIDTFVLAIMAQGCVPR